MDYPWGVSTVRWMARNRVTEPSGSWWGWGQLNYGGVIPKKLRLGCGSQVSSLVQEHLHKKSEPGPALEAFTGFV